MHFDDQNLYDLLAFELHIVTSSPELLMPAGNLEKLKFAIAFGADAVYAGVPAYSLRARENQFNIEFLKETTKYCHDRKKKIYFTANIFPHNVKIPHFLRAMEKMMGLKPDAFIMADPGIIHLTKKHFPDAVIHLSVQANNVNWASAQFWHEQGIERIILSRELSLKEIQEISEKNPELEIECFVHGAICMAYSGRCLLSNYFTYRDANQGTCAHSCRWKYKLHEGKENYAGEVEEYVPLSGNFYLEEEERPKQMLEIDEDQYGTYIMNSKDLCLLEYLPDLIKARVSSLKVEGRSKTIYYAAITARAYRMAIDAIQKKKFTKKIIDELLDEVFSTSNRGYIPGFLVGNPKEKGQEYEERKELGTHVFAGVVRSRKGNEVEMECRNRLDIGDELEFCFPNKTEDFSIVLKDFRNHKGEAVENFSGGAGSIFLDISDKQKKIFEKNFGENDEIFCVVRKSVK
ncbi:U32 family peptidase C-terminal domain-containing protein [Candidatus Peregrinibacteria bacterium]|nr:U32 family peptidase C-terminal domain-containing protein [Candidatus Peregrinibacteria bacterium]